MTPQRRQMDSAARSKKQFKAMFWCLRIAVVAVVCCIYFATPSLVRFMILADAKEHALIWMKEVEKKQSLPGYVPKEIDSYTARVASAIFDSSVSYVGQEVDINDPASFEMSDTFTKIIGYAVYSSYGERQFNSGDGLYSTSELEGEPNHIEQVAKTGQAFAIERTDQDDGSLRIITVFMPLMSGKLVRGVAEIDMQRHPLELAISNTLQRGSLAMAVVVSLGAFLMLYLLRTIAIRRDAAQDEMHFFAYRDPLTKLANRRSFQEDIGPWLSEICAPGGAGGALICLDLDGFKAVNDIHGHQMGDKLLREVAKRLQTVYSARVYRLSGDEFTLLVRGTKGDERVDAVTKKVARVCNSLFTIDGIELSVKASTGVARCPEHSTNNKELMKFADLALYENKGSSDDYTYFNPEFEERLTRKNYVLERLKTAIDEERLVTIYQPQVDTSTGTITGCEALVRLPDDDGEFISPAEFIPLAENTDLILKLGEQVLRAACRAAVTWEDHVNVAVNVSPLQLQTGRFCHLVERVLTETGLHPTRLELEITEGVVLREEEHVLSQINRLREMGVGLAMDDFGTGYSSLLYLARMPFTKIKIDRAFVSKMMDDPSAEAIIKAVIQISQSVKAKVIAEGVETHEQTRFLAELGCTDIQGFLFGKPSVNPFENDSPVVHQVEEIRQRLAG